MPAVIARRFALNRQLIGRGKATGDCANGSPRVQAGQSQPWQREGARDTDYLEVWEPFGCGHPVIELSLPYDTWLRGSDSQVIEEMKCGPVNLAIICLLLQIYDSHHRFSGKSHCRAELNCTNNSFCSCELSGVRRGVYGSGVRTSRAIVYLNHKQVRRVKNRFGKISVCRVRGSEAFVMQFIRSN